MSAQGACVVGMRIAFPGDAASLAAGLLPQQSWPGRVAMNRADITSPQSCWDFPSPRSVKDGRGSMQNPSQRGSHSGPKAALLSLYSRQCAKNLPRVTPPIPCSPWCPGGSGALGAWWVVLMGVWPMSAGRGTGHALCTDQCLQQNVFLLHLVVSIFQLFLLCEDPLPLRPWPSEVPHLFTRSTACLSV